MIKKASVSFGNKGILIKYLKLFFDDPL